MYLDNLMLARALHVVGVVFWIGGVAMVTTVLLPTIKAFTQTADKVALFERIERRFAHQARISTLLTGISGFTMLELMNTWSRYFSIHFWWLHAMTLVWAIFTVMLFIAEPLFLHQWFLARAQRYPESTFKLIQRLHWILLTLSIITVIGAVVGSHGGRWF